MVGSLIVLVFFFTTAKYGAKSVVELKNFFDLTVPAISVYEDSAYLLGLHETKW